jgi:tetratricopeptide (TPR) repeat protein
LLVVLSAAVAAGGAMAWRLRPSGPELDPKRLGLLQAAWQEFDGGRYEQTIAILDRRAAEVSTTALDWMLRARVAEAQGRMVDALEDLKHIPDSDPIAAQAWLKAGQIERARHHARAAEAAFRRALELNPDQVQSRRELVYIYALQRRKADCDAQFRSLSRLMTFDYVLAFLWGQTECDIWDPDEAIRALVPILAADPEDRWSRLALATDYRLARRYDEAEATLRVLPDSDPDARAIRVRAALDRGDFGAAEKLANQGPDDNARLNSLRGRLALQLNDPARAADLFRAVLRAEPHDRDAIGGLGSALQRMRDPRAEEFLRQAHSRDELKRTIVACGNMSQIDPKVFPELARLSEAIGRRDQAVVWYQVAISWDPLNNQAQQGLSRLRRLEEGAHAEASTGRDGAR